MSGTTSWRRRYLKTLSIGSSIADADGIRFLIIAPIAMTVLND
jgi:hypothetical protein